MFPSSPAASSPTSIIWGWERRPSCCPRLKTCRTAIEHAWRQHTIFLDLLFLAPCVLLAPFLLVVIRCHQSCCRLPLLNFSKNLSPHRNLLEKDRRQSQFCGWVVVVGQVILVGGRSPGGWNSIIHHHWNDRLWGRGKNFLVAIESFCTGSKPVRWPFSRRDQATPNHRWFCGRYQALSFWGTGAYTCCTFAYCTQRRPYPRIASIGRVQLLAPWIQKNYMKNLTLHTCFCGAEIRGWPAFVQHTAESHLIDRLEVEESEMREPFHFACEED